MERGGAFEAASFLDQIFERPGHNPILRIKISALMTRRAASTSCLR
jgi:hypothetical protein